MSFRDARRDDLPRIVELIADDAVAARRTGAFGAAHVRGFEAIQASPDNDLVVVELPATDLPGEMRDGTPFVVVGCMQLTYIPGISRNGVGRLLVEAVRVDAALRGQGIGSLLMEHAHERGRARGCVLAQLTSDKRRPEAHRFYRSLGYEQSHEGFKLPLDRSRPC
ncbi:GNAT family N-acetyltransferase [Myceligenerans sp. TRM 65318]|uniref:GNAT family N-acetyltransferase n=1 Tax=Myceligenerans pegani TaxID=2776917 RepID=A0ABR9MUL7_9MICO|nr:GNAT family N-acetyltransferase [Myceligenerans sp. TRM 65318]MBE3017022.1 GNAT family N-acetyltransferase [Myceligenerans sp. TRM 65318]